ncbi:MAG: hypothetical protein LUQ36_11480 [Methanoregula sp.]|jgi:hypothetical protein|nr:hypothetical protein [Methanoregula sp.]
MKKTEDFTIPDQKKKQGPSLLLSSTPVPFPATVPGLRLKNPGIPVKKSISIPWTLFRMQVIFP